MARRISSLFGLNKDGLHDGQQHEEIYLQDPWQNSPQNPSNMGKFMGNKGLTKSPSLLDLADPHAALPPPPVMTDMGVRPVSRDSRRSSRTESHGTRDSSGSRPSTPTYFGISSVPSSPKLGPEQAGKLAKRKTWVPGKTDKHGHSSDEETSEAWVAGLKEHVPYDITPLLRGERVAELWDPEGNVEVFLFPQTSHRGPSFRVSSNLFADSQLLRYLNDPQNTNDGNLSKTNGSQSYQLQPAMAELNLGEGPRSIARKPLANSQTIAGEVGRRRSSVSHSQQVYLPLDFVGDLSHPKTMPKGDDLELLVLYRNFFSFLKGGALVSTPRQNSLYSVFMGISSILRRLRFGNDKNSSWGVIPWASFSRYTEELRLTDVRTSREKNIEAIVLGEAMKSWPLYNEGFVHAVGRLDDLKQIKSAKFAKISPTTINRLERANLDLQQRLSAVRTKLDNFYFPSMFAGVANSQTATEAKLVHFKAWKVAFTDFRTFIMTTYKKRYGSWPPKASSKKNSFEESGLNRLLLREVYQDFTDLYDMLADRQSLTTRTTDMPTIADDARSGSNETIQHVLRSMESEHDRSVPPVNPPIPFDVPLIPAFVNSFSRDHILTKKDPLAKKLRDSDVNALLLGSYNRESIKPTTFCQDFLAYERKLGTGKTVQELVDNRCGQWLFIYAVLQALPMTVVDARDLQFTEGCESFLCIAPRGGRPWMKEDTSTSRAWYNVASGGGLISLPADMIDHSVEGIYRRSHCWEVATKWAEHLNTPQPQGNQLLSAMMANPAQHTARPSHLAPVSAAPNSSTSSHASALARPRSAHGSVDSYALSPYPHDTETQYRRSSMNIGLEEVAAPVQSPSRPVAVHNPNITFDNILGSPQQAGKKTKKK